MAEPLLVTVRLTVQTREHRDEGLRKILEIVKAAEGESGTSKYALCIPREDNGKDFYVIEEYDNKAAFDLHMTGPAVKAAQTWFGEDGVMDASCPPAMDMMQYLPGQRFTRPEIVKHEDPHVLYAELDYVPGGIQTATPYWQAVVDTGRDHETGTLQYGVAKPLEKDNRLVTFEVYESLAYLKDVHVPSDAIQNSIAKTKHLRTGLKHHTLKMVGGFLHK